MRNIIVYFHGYGSSVLTNKVDMLKTIPNTEVYAYPANIDPIVAIYEVSAAIDDMLLTDIVSEVNMTFIGTSLGAWLASKLGEMYGVKTVLINPSVTPFITLKRYGVSDEICAKYDSPIYPKHTDRFIFAEHDDVIDNVPFRNFLIDNGFDVTIAPGADHHFAGEFFKRYVVSRCLFASDMV